MVRCSGKLTLFYVLAICVVLNSLSVAATRCDFTTQRVQCGDLACDAASHTCVKCRTDAECYPEAMRCDAGTGNCVVKPFLAILNLNTVLALLGAFFVCAIGVIAGVGGGGILVPMFTPLMRLPMVSAVALSQSTICGQTTLNVYLSARQRHPDLSWSRPLINYQYLGLLLPLGLIGTLIGSVLNNICSDFLRLLLLFVLLSAVLVRTIKKTRKQFETDRAAAQEAKLQKEKRDHVIPPQTGGQGDKTILMSSTEQIYHSVDNTTGPPSSRATPQTLTRPPLPQYPRSEIIMNVASFIVLLVFNILRTYCPCGSPLFWICFFAPLTFLAEVFYFYRKHLGRLAEEQPEALTFRWNRNNNLTFPMVAVVAGAAAAMLGIGGGLVLGFVMYEVGLSPEETSVTGGTATFYIAFSSGLQLLITGRLQLDASIVGFAVGLASTALGQLVIMDYIRRHGLRFLIVGSLALIVGGSLLVLGGYSIYEAIHTIRSGGSIFSIGHLCH